jgi:type IV secretory pathway TrbF-like protein
MNWRRAAMRYGQTPAPATPYQRAEQLWDERIGSARVQAANWRLIAFAAMALAGVTMGDDIRAHSRSSVTPYVRRSGSHRCSECNLAGSHRLPAERRADRLFLRALCSEYARAFRRPDCCAPSVARCL